MSLTAIRAAAGVSLSVCQMVPSAAAAVDRQHPGESPGAAGLAQRQPHTARRGRHHGPLPAQPAALRPHGLQTVRQQVSCRSGGGALGGEGDLVGLCWREN